MEIKHRLNSEERQHYLLKHKYSLRVKPRLLYAGELKNAEAWSESQHQHDFVEILFVKKGKGMVQIEDNVTEVTKGDIIIYNSGIPHSEKSDTSHPLELYFLALGKLSITDLEENVMLPPGYSNIYKSGALYDLFCTMFRQIILEFENKDPFFAEIAQNISRTMLMYIFRLINYSDTEKEKLHSNKVISRALKYIDENYRREMTLSEISEYCYVSKYYLSHLFTSHEGVSLKQYIISKRITEAKQLLCTKDMSVGEIATAVGFHDAAYFSRLFKKNCGENPLEYRKRNNTPK